MTTRLPFFQCQISPRFAYGNSDITADIVSEAVSRGLRRRFAGVANAAKILARQLGFDPRIANKLLCGTTTVSSPGLIVLMREIEEVREEILRLAGAGDAAEAARLKATIDSIETALSGLRNDAPRSHGVRGHEHRSGVPSLGRIGA